MTIQESQDELEQLIGEHDALAHLCVKKHGKSLIVFSGVGADEQKHARLTQFGSDQWGLSFQLHTGRWEKTPFTGSLSELWETLHTDFPFHLDHH